MNKIIIALIFIILIVASFFIGYSRDKPCPVSVEIQNLQNQIDSIQEENAQLLEQVADLQNRIHEQENNSLINEEEECKSKGGIWHKYLLPSDELLDNPFCQLPFSDAGKECTDSSQCLGNCEPPQEFLKREGGNWVISYRENVSGTCSKFSKGCESHQIMNGTLDLESQAICVN